MFSPDTRVLPLKQTQASVSQVVDLAAAALPNQPPAPAESLAHCSWHCSLAGWRESGKRMDIRQLWRQMQTKKDKNCLSKGSSKAASQPCTGHAGSDLLSSASGSWWRTGNPSTLLSLLPLFFWQKGGMERKRLLTRQQQTDKSV